MAGYSGTPLVKKLGIKPGTNVRFVNPPARFAQRLDLPVDVTVNQSARKPFDFVLLFVNSKKQLMQKFSRLAEELDHAGMLWIAWPKKSSGVVSDLTENVVRKIGLAAGLVDVKVCAVNDVWSGLKFVFRLRDRPKL